MDAYDQHIADKRARAEVEAATPAAGPGTPDGHGWYFRTLADGVVEWRPDGEDWPPAGWRWDVDPHDPHATGGPAYTSLEQQEGRSVAKLRRIDEGPTNPTPTPMRMTRYSSATGRYEEEWTPWTN